jgi:hypothetical protein
MLVPMEHSTALTVEQALQDAALRTGVPRLIVSDQGGDVRAGMKPPLSGRAVVELTSPARNI